MLPRIFSSGGRVFAKATFIGTLLIIPMACGGGSDNTPSTPTPAAPTLTIDPNWKTSVSYIGRFDQSNATGPEFSWSGTALKAAFQGTNISLKLARSGVPTDAATKDDYVDVKIDDGTATKLTIDHDGMYTLASNLTSGNHTIQVTKRDEGQYAQMQYLGFAFKEGKLLTPPAHPNRRIEFVGDSISCGYGDEAASKDDHFTTVTENVDLAYDTLTADSLNAEPAIIAWSGKGVVMNYGGTTDTLASTFYSRTLAPDAAVQWDFTKWIPQVVVINLGTNDFGNITNTAFSADTFVTGYKDLVATVREHYPDAYIFCAVGPMLWGDGLTSAINCIQVRVVQALNAAGDSKIYYIEFPQQDGSDGYGADWHPSLARHLKMADQLTTAIQDTVGTAW